METTTRLDSRHKPTQKLIRMRKVGKGYGFIFDSYLCHGTDLFFNEYSSEVLVTHTKDLGQIIHRVHVVAD